MTVTPPAFADVPAVAAGWRDLSTDEQTRADDLLPAIGRWIRREREEAGSPIEDDDPDAYLVSVEVVREMLVAQNARLAAEKYAGFSQVQKTLGPRSVGGTIASSSSAGGFMLSPWMLKLLGLDADDGIARAALPQATFGDGDFRERW